VKIKITKDEAVILWRLLNSGAAKQNGADVRADIGSREMYALWDRLDDKMAERSIPTDSY
jgi:hypothetical protein